MTHAARPLIGIEADFAPAGSPGTPARLDAGCFDAVLAAGGLPVVLPPLRTEAEIQTLLEQVDGVLLTDGRDPPQRREASDPLLVRRLVQRQMPVLAVGEGMQRFNVGCGGSLYLHLPDDHPGSLPHRTAGVPHRHAVLLEPHTRLAELYGGGEIRVPSDHHQAVRRVGHGLCTSARAPDGVIEAIEAADPTWFCMGVQWHPEWHGSCCRDLQLFESFIEACRVRVPSLALVA